LKGILLEGVGQKTTEIKTKKGEINPGEKKNSVEQEWPSIANRKRIRLEERRKEGNQRKERVQ